MIKKKAQSETELTLSPVAARLTVNPDLLIIARESRGLNQSELARAINVTQSKISKYEAKLLEVNEDDLIKIAVALDYPPTFFFRTETILGLASGCLHHRKRQSAPIRELRMIHGTVNAIRIHVAKLFAVAEIETENKFIRLDIDDHESPAAIARVVRAHWRLPMGPIRNLVRVIENAGGVVIQYPFETTRIDAVSQWPGNAPPIFFVNKSLPVDRWRWSLAHELGHIIMHSVPSQNGEAEADEFASELLMPAREISGDLADMTLSKAARLKPFWRTSMQSIIRKSRDVGRISPNHYRNLCTQISMLGYRKHEPSPLAPEEPTVLRDLIAAHEQKMEYSLSQLLRITDCTDNQFRRLFHYQDKTAAPKLRIV